MRKMRGIWCAFSFLLLGSFGLPILVDAATNTWEQPPLTVTRRWVPASFTDCTTSQLSTNPQGRNFSGSVYGNGKVYYWGGAHNTYPGNDMDVYEISNNRWSNDYLGADGTGTTPIVSQCWAPCSPMSGGIPTGRSGNPQCDNWPVNAPCSIEPYNLSCLTGSPALISGKTSKPVFRCMGGVRDQQTCSSDADCSGGQCLVTLPTPGTPCPNCRPYTDHTYQKGAFNFRRGKPLWAIDSGTWEWDPATRSWAWLAPPPSQSADNANRLVMWAGGSHQRIFQFQAGGNNKGVYIFDDATNTWIAYDAYLPTGNSWVEPFGFWDEHANKFVITLITNHIAQWFVYDPALRGVSAWKEITPTAPRDIIPQCAGGTGTPCFSGGITYDEAHRRTMVLTQETGGVLKLWVYDAVADVWQRVDAIGASAGRRASGYPNTLHYDVGTDALYLIDNGSFWMNNIGGTVRTWKITVNLGTQTSGDLNADGSVDAVDLQLMVNILLGLGANPLADLNGSGSADALDLQLLVNQLLGV